MYRPEPQNRDLFAIADLAKEFGISTRAIRFYEAKGLLMPERVGATRVFRRRDRARLILILRGKRLGFSLPEIAVIVNMYDEPPGERGQLEYLIEQCDVRRAQLEQQRRDIADTLARLDVVERRCRQELAELPDSRA